MDFVYTKSMKETLTIRQTKIGEGKPLLCAPIIEEARDGILSECRSLMNTSADMIEWRADLFEEIGNTEAVIAILERMRVIVGEKLLLFTCRSRQQGGNGALSEEGNIQLLLAVAESGYADLIDLEYFAVKRPEKAIRQLHEAGAVIVASHHDFQETPPVEAIEQLLDNMASSGADIVKLAVMPKNMEDVLRLLAATERFKKEWPDKPIITMSMGRYGMLSRMCGEFFGIAVTFGYHRRASAPGQIALDELSQMLTKIHEEYGEEPV